ncbi:MULTISPECIES: HEAT repeat domain-containing protein [unclassified Streptomyces]|uniref:HEAT repeat domain-containing protein n=1 Tax=unclassified Streptomyces TaxID=2593676 RepID=UPI002E2D323E|nr:HEAT repeat domain-containing protein [Streptomyces sp. NBC_01423]WSX89119.1 HEAT repeat domain-containing protein [Streptomyces sp. NBC_00891]WSY03598.1 HEAT repeat domain-containing protein [Streptomyces sp. NBC_00890]WSZ05225.1 HEAT repeat domain-containing protein [Streptomyces sp. NBC_00869]WSZ27280.1 HEAT repeat domain-containing protein [Streptomyces sp. NBC_00870]
MSGHQLVAEVRAGRAHLVRDALWAGADPETTDADGVPVLCIAVAAFDGHVADALLDAGADPLRPLPDGSTPLLRTVISGNAGLTAALLGHAANRLTEKDRAELLACAGRWCGTGAEAGLRLATGATGPVVRRRVPDDFGVTAYDMLTLGGMSVYDGHGAVLTRLEAMFGVHRPFDVLLTRALARADGDHADWTEVGAVLAERSGAEAWGSVPALRSASDPLRRLFAADLVRQLLALDAESAERHAADVLLPWAAEETDPAALASVLGGLMYLDEPAAEGVGLPHHAHPDPRVRMVVPSLLNRTRYAYTHPEAWEVLAALASDPDARVRAAVCELLYEFEGCGPVGADLLAGFLREDDQLVRIKAVSGLALADDARCVEGARQIGPVGRSEWPDTWLLDAATRYAQRHGN